jgi:hypothetical protein
MPHSDGEDWIATHEAFKCSRTWDNLAFDGIQGGGGAMLVEHRRCPDCGSTISRPVDLDRASRLVSHLGAILTVSLDAVATAARAVAVTSTAPTEVTKRRRSNKQNCRSAAAQSESVASSAESWRAA